MSCCFHLSSQLNLPERLITFSGFVNTSYSYLPEERDKGIIVRIATGMHAFFSGRGIYRMGRRPAGHKVFSFFTGHLNNSSLNFYK